MNYDDVPYVYTEAWIDVCRAVKKHGMVKTDSVGWRKKEFIDYCEEVGRYNPAFNDMEFEIVHQESDPEHPENEVYVVVDKKRRNTTNRENSCMLSSEY